MERLQGNRIGEKDLSIINSQQGSIFGVLSAKSMNIDLEKCVCSFLQVSSGFSTNHGIWQRYTVAQTRFGQEGASAGRGTFSMNDLHEAYMSVVEPEVSQFLTANEFLVEIMNEAVPYVHNLYGADARLSLSLLNLSENGADDVLFVNIQTALDPIVAVERLDEFLNGWFIDKMLETDGKLSFDVQVMEG